ncbi:Cobyrinate a,c-diamide synthase [subsurface metagenome]
MQAVRLNSQSEAYMGKRLPRIVISACQGHLGKTTVSIGLCAAYAERGLAVQPFKKGPDYIDPSWLTAAANRDCRNLDAYQMPEEAILLSFQRVCQEADLALIEGVMGLYDSFTLDGRGSTAWIARLLGAPVILLINASRMTRSVAAMTTGYQRFEPDTNIAGVILNNVSTDGHKQRLVAAIERYCDIPVLGIIPPDDNLNIAEQHLGLRPYRHRRFEEANAIVERIRDRIKAYLDLDGILAIANSGAQWIPSTNEPERKAPVVQIGVIRDRVFNFYYPENLEALHQAGANLVFIDSLRDEGLPDIDGLYIGGGFPELFLERLEANSKLRHDIAQAAKDGLPIYAECAGLMYLCHSIHWHDQRYEMVGVIPCDVEICQQPQGHGYVEVEVVAENPLFPIGMKIHGHEYHHSKLSSLDGFKLAYKLLRGRGAGKQSDAIVSNNVFAAYTHLHALGVPQWAEAFVSLASRVKSLSPTF